MSLEELINLKAHGVPSELEALINSLISVSSQKAINTRETPGIISLITEEEIRNSGARDLIDILRQIPGIDFGVDVEGVVGLGMRGSWANEGKILILLDGQETNEIMYASSQLGNRFPIDLIKRIEIIRGPGSAIYGGYAEYGVINIVTKQADDLNGVFASVTYGQMVRDYGRKNVSVAFGKRLKDFSFSLSSFIGRGQRSDQTYKDYNGDSYDMKGNSHLNTNYINFGAKYKGLSLRFILDDYNIQIKDGYGNVIKKGQLESHFENLFFELKHELKFNQKWKITSRVNHKIQQPWENLGYEGTQPYNKHANRTIGNVTTTYDPTRKFNITFGSEAYYDQAKDLTQGAVFNNNKNTISYYNYAVFAQSLFKMTYTNIILGARLDNHNAFGSAFVPRVGLTKKLNKFHYKLLFGRSFRAPSIENINDAGSTGIKPEFTNVTECEIGYQLTKHSLLSFNVFDIDTKLPIVYFTSQENNDDDYYTNSGSSGSQGIEAEYKYKSKWGQINVNYAFYSTANKTKIPTYQTGESSSLLAFANHRINFSSQFKFNAHFSANISASYFSKRWYVSGYDTSGNSILDQTKPILLLNCFLQFKSEKKGLNIGVGVFDLLNEKFAFIQPYNGGHAPLPGPSREIVVRIQYNLNFKKKTD
jgi:outer membrane receptor for ferrienterochelin and colicin